MTDRASGVEPLTTALRDAIDTVSVADAATYVAGHPCSDAMVDHILRGIEAAVSAREKAYAEAGIAPLVERYERAALRHGGPQVKSETEKKRLIQALRDGDMETFTEAIRKVNVHHCCSGCDAKAHCTHGYEPRAALPSTTEGGKDE